MKRIPRTELEVHSLCLGGNVFGWTADAATSHRILDRYADAGGNFVDTADMYSAWADGNVGGESEQVIGDWMAARGNRAQMVIATKVGKKPGRQGLAEGTIRRALDESLKRLRTDTIDLYYAHADDADTPIDETLAAFRDAIEAGKVRYIGASNYGAARLREAAEEAGLPHFVALQPHYNLMERDYEEELAPTAAELQLGVFPYFALANGFLTGKYRPGSVPDSERADRGRKLLESPRGVPMLRALDAVAARHGTSLAAVALAWLAAKPTVTSPIASARTVAQLEELLPMATLRLEAEDLAQLDAAY